MILKWFKIKPDDILLDSCVAELSPKEQGILLRAWCWAARQGSLSNNPVQIRHSLRLDRRTDVDFLFQFFTIQDGDRMYCNEIEEQRNFCNEKREKLSKNGKLGGRGQKAKAFQLESNWKANAKQLESNSKAFGKQMLSKRAGGSDTDTEKELQNISQSEGTDLGGSASGGGRTDGFCASVNQALENTGLSPLQVTKIQQETPWKEAEVWQILESLRVHGQKLTSKAGTAYNALLDLAKGRPWVDRVADLYAKAGWVEVAEDGTDFADPVRREYGAALASKGLRRAQPTPEVLARRAGLLAAQESQKSVNNKSNLDPETAKAWESVCGALPAAAKLLASCVALRLQDGILTVRSPGGDLAGLLGDDLALAAEAADIVGIDFV